MVQGHKKVVKFVMCKKKRRMNGYGERKGFEHTEKKDEEGEVMGRERQVRKGYKEAAKGEDR